MSNNTDRLRLLFQKYASDEITPEEADELFDWIRPSGNEIELKNFLTEILEATPRALDYDQSKWDKIADTILSAGEVIPEVSITIDKTEGKQRYLTWSRMAAAALVIFSLSAGTYWFITRNDAMPLISRNDDLSLRYKNDVAPGGSRATLTLGDSSTIVLDDAGNGSVAYQGNTNIVKVNAGTLTYDATGETAHTVLYNTITTPRGGQYQVSLPDGTHVWLNAESSLRFPTAFNGTERNVTITGEAYFEVVKNSDMPFKVRVNEMTVEVLGTHFNVMAYAGERSVNTTLLEGSVNVYSGETATRLVPGEQAQVNELNEIRVVKDDGLSTAWKKGLFMFKSSDIETIMRQAARWYDIEVAYVGEPMKDTFTGKVSRNVNLSQLLKMLELSEVRFTIEGRKITVFP